MTDHAPTESEVPEVDNRGSWYVLQTLSGQEMKAQESINKRRVMEEVDDVLYEALVPVQKVTEVKLGKRTTTNKKFFPGYILIRCDLYNDKKRINDRVWTFIQDTPGIIGFIGDNPQPLSKYEVQDILDQVRGEEEAPKPKIDYTVGEIVKIKEGPFENLEGKIEVIDPDRGKLKLSVIIFDRSTPVEVEYWQVERAD